MPKPGEPLRAVQAAQLRAKAVRWGLGKLALALLFLVGALAYALGPDPHVQSSTFWMTALVFLSTFNFGLGLRTLARARRGGLRSWPFLTAAWAVLGVALLRLLLALR